MTFTINAIPFVITSLNTQPLSLEFREERRMLSTNLRIKQRLTTAKKYQEISISVISQADFNSLEPLVNGGFYTCTLSSSGHDFTGSFTILCPEFPASYNGTKKDLKLTLKPS